MRGADLLEARTELKYLLQGARGADLKAELSSRLCPHHHESETSAIAPMAHHYTTTVYFDTAGLDFFRKARAGGQHVKLRAREYYDVLPLEELVTDAGDLLRYAPLLWLELKSRDGDLSGKRRIGVPKRRLMALLDSVSIDDELRAIQRQAHGGDGEAALGELVRFLERLGKPLRPSAAVNYRRAAYQDPAGSLRLTVDDELAFYAPREALWASESPLTRAVLGPPVAVEPRLVVEVKHLGMLPSWLPEALTAMGAERTDFSKFAAATEAVTAAGRPPT